MTTARAIIAGAVLIALALVAAAFLSQPRYSMTNVGNGYSLRLDRRTGEMVGCNRGECAPVSQNTKPDPWAQFPDAKVPATAAPKAN